MSAQPADETRQLDHVREDLHAEFAQLPHDVVDAHLGAVLDGLRRAPVRTYVPVLARRGARERLRHLDE